jgi:hypothetical protein
MVDENIYSAILNAFRKLVWKIFVFKGYTHDDKGMA